MSLDEHLFQRRRQQLGGFGTIAASSGNVDWHQFWWLMAFFHHPASWFIWPSPVTDFEPRIVPIYETAIKPQINFCERKSGRHVPWNNAALNNSMILIFSELFSRKLVIP